jgi:hypothetical protein
VASKAGAAVVTHPASNGAVEAPRDRSPVIFAAPWWLDAVAPGAWAEVVVERGGRVEARLPYVSARRRGLTLLVTPPLTKTLGPWLRPALGKSTTRLEREKELMTELIDGLPAFDHFDQNFHPSVANWLPFHWRGFEETTRYTYVLPDLGDEDALWSGLRENVRRAVRKARRSLEVRDDLGLDAFLDVHAKTFERQGQSMPYARDLVARLDAACTERGCRRTLFAVDAAGAVHAAAYVVWDATSAYYLMGGGDPELRESGAGSLVIWEAIRAAATVAPQFDFEGSMLEPVERFFRAFGGEQRPYFHVTKTSSRLLKMKRDVRSWLGGS